MKQQQVMQGDNNEAADWQETLCSRLIEHRLADQPVSLLQMAQPGQVMGLKAKAACRVTHWTHLISPGRPPLVLAEWSGQHQHP